MQVPNFEDGFDPSVIDQYGGNNKDVINIRKVALFEGNDEYGRLQPLLGVAEPTVDVQGNAVNGVIAWASPTTENPRLRLMMRKYGKSTTQQAMHIRSICTW